MRVSNCCAALVQDNSDICPYCHEHCEVEYEDDESIGSLFFIAETLKGVIVNPLDFLMLPWIPVELQYGMVYSAKILCYHNYIRVTFYNNVEDMFNDRYKLSKSGIASDKFGSMKQFTDVWNILDRRILVEKNMDMGILTF